MTWRLQGLERKMWHMTGKASGRCGSCDWHQDGLSAVRVNRLARSHTRATGHATRTAQVKITEYRRADGPEPSRAG